VSLTMGHCRLGGQGCEAKTVYQTNSAPRCEPQTSAGHIPYNSSRICLSAWESPESRFYGRFSSFEDHSHQLMGKGGFSFWRAWRIAWRRDRLLNGPTISYCEEEISWLMFGSCPNSGDHCLREREGRMVETSDDDKQEPLDRLQRSGLILLESRLVADAWHRFTGEYCLEDSDPSVEISSR
jgi:hypothetical protein